MREKNNTVNCKDITKEIKEKHKCYSQESRYENSVLQEMSKLRNFDNIHSEILLTYKK